MDKKTMMEDLAREAVEKAGFTGTWLYAEKGEIVSMGAAGWRDPEDSLPMQVDSVFDLASVSKQFTAAAVMLLKRRGLLDLEDEITKFFPEVPYKGVTIRHLLNHTGGLPDYMDWIDETAKKENRIPGNDMIVRFLSECGEEPVFAPGDQWEYSNTGYCLLAQIVEKAAGVPFEVFMQENVFEPAGLTSTHVYHRRKDHLTIENLAYGMLLELGSDKYVLPDDSGESAYVVTLDGASGDGLVHSNVLDLLTWDRVLREGKVLTKEEQELMYTPVILNNGEMGRDEEEEGDPGYGFGWEILGDPEQGLIVFHSGGWPGYSTWYERYIDEDKVYVLLSSRDSKDERAYQSFCKGMKAIVKGEEPEPIHCIEELMVKDPDRSGWDAFCGKYDFGEAIFRIEEIVRKGEDLYAKVVYRENRYDLKLYPLGEKTFGIKDLDGDITFDDEGLTLWEETHKKL